MAKVDISVIAPVFNEAETLPLLVRRVHDVMAGTKYTWELVAVDDGSSDNSPSIMAALTKDYPNFKPIYFRRNYGQTAAMQAGFDHAEGDIFVTIDADLQNDPKDIPRLLKHMEKTGADIVSGWRKNRKDAALRRNFPSRIGNALIGKVTKVKLHDYGCSLKAYTRECLQDVKIYGELHRFIPAIASQYGAKIEEIVVTHHPRQFGESKYGLDKTFRVILDLILIQFFLKYINRPMHAFGYLGLIMLVPGGLIATYLTFIKVFMDVDIGSRPLLTLAVMLIILGIQLIGMGVLGELLVRIYHEPAGRKQYSLRTVKAATSKRKKPTKRKVKK